MALIDAAVKYAGEEATPRSPNDGSSPTPDKERHEERRPSSTVRLPTSSISHRHPGFDATFAEAMEKYGIEDPMAKPVVIGQMGAFRPSFGTADDAAANLVEWQRESCAYGIDGWLLWTWDSGEQPELWNALSAGGAIEQALAPRNRTNPCA
jgi:hypothetical protein